MFTMIILMQQENHLQICPEFGGDPHSDVALNARQKISLDVFDDFYVVFFFNILVRSVLQKFAEFQIIMRPDNRAAGNAR